MIAFLKALPQLISMFKELNRLIKTFRGSQILEYFEKRDKEMNEVATQISHAKTDAERLELVKRLNTISSK